MSVPPSPLSTDRLVHRPLGGQTVNFLVNDWSADKAGGGSMPSFVASVEVTHSFFFFFAMVWWSKSQVSVITLDLQ